MVLVRALSPIFSVKNEKKSGKQGDSNFKNVDRYADVNVRDVTFFIRSSKCTELIQIRFDLFDLERNVKSIKSKLTGIEVEKSSIRIEPFLQPIFELLKVWPRM